MKELKVLIILFGLMLHTGSIAQIHITQGRDTSKHQAFISTGIEPHWVSTIGYTNHVALNDKVNLYLGASLKVPIIILTSGAWRANIITGTSWNINKRWSTSTILAFYLAHDHNRAGAMNGIGTEFRIVPLHRGKKWFKGIDIGWQHTAFTHIKHSEEAKETFQERYTEDFQNVNGLKDGWYASTANRFRIGFLGAMKIKQYTITASAGGLWILQRQGIAFGFAHAQIPFYIETGLQYTW